MYLNIPTFKKISKKLNFSIIFCPLWLLLFSSCWWLTTTTRIQHPQVGSSHYSTFSISTTLLFSFWVFFFILLGKRSSEIPTTVTLTRIFLLHAKTPQNQMHAAWNSMENAARAIFQKISSFNFTYLKTCYLNVHML